MHEVFTQIECAARKPFGSATFRMSPKGWLPIPRAAMEALSPKRPMPLALEPALEPLTQMSHILDK